MEKEDIEIFSKILAEIVIKQDTKIELLASALLENSKAGVLRTETIKQQNDKLDEIFAVLGKQARGISSIMLIICFILGALTTAGVVKFLP
ncbi:MAG TPA: hypothetical protein VLS45_06495 [Methylomicrobium sp.]|nr:hypothetical protein [Methylomicrobium sp.]